MKFKNLIVNVGILLVMATTGAEASTVSCDGNGEDSVCSATQTVIGSDFTVFSFQVAEAGFFDLTLLDYVFPTEPLSSLSLLLSTGTQAIGQLSGEGVLTFFAAPGEYFIQIFASASSSKDVGLYGIDVVVNPVPLPSALLLLGSAMLAFVFFTRRREKYDESPQPLVA